MHKHLMVAAIIGWGTASVEAADLKVIAVPPIKDSLTEIARQFETATGHKVETRISSGLDLLKMGAASPFDIAFVLRPLLNEAEAAALFRTDSVTSIGSSGLGVAIRAGLAKPDVAATETLKQALLKARNFGIVPSSTVGGQVARILEKLEIAEAMKSKLVVRRIVDEVIRDMVSGEIEITIIPINVIAGAPGIDLVAPLPAPLQQAVPVVAALPLKEGPNPEGARALLSMFKSPTGAAVLISKGLTPE